MMGPAKLAAYFANLLQVGITSGSIPRLLRVRNALQAGDISRREFFQRVALIRNEAKAQANLLAVGAEMESNRQKATLGLKVNKGIVDKIANAKSRSEKMTPRIVKTEIRKKTQQLLNKGPKEVNKQHYDFMKYINEEGFFMEGNPPGTNRYINNFRAIYKNDMKKSPKSLKKMAEDVIGYDVHDTNMVYDIGEALEMALRKKLGVTKEMATKIWKLKKMAREGTDGFRDPLLQRWYTARKKLTDITKQSSTEMGDYAMTKLKDQNWNFTRPSGHDISEPVRIVKKAVKDITKHGESKVKSIWDGLSEEFKKGYHGIDKIK